MHHDHGYWKSSHPEVVDGDEEVSPVQFLNPRDLLRNPLQNELQQPTSNYTVTVPLYSSLPLPDRESRLPGNVPGPSLALNPWNAMQLPVRLTGQDLPNGTCMDRKMEPNGPEDLEDYSHGPDMLMALNGHRSEALSIPDTKFPDCSMDTIAATKTERKRATMIGSSIPLVGRRRDGIKATRSHLAAQGKTVVKPRPSIRQHSSVHKKRKAPNIFHCVWKCGKTFNRPGNLFRHEESKHLELTRWICARTGPTNPVTGKCVYCKRFHGGPIRGSMDFPDSAALGGYSSPYCALKGMDPPVSYDALESASEDDSFQPPLGDSCPQPPPPADYTWSLASPPGEECGDVSSPALPKESDPRVQRTPGVNSRPNDARWPLTRACTTSTSATASLNRMYTHRYPGISTRSGYPRLTYAEEDQSFVHGGPQLADNQPLGVMTPESLPSPGAEKAMKPPDGVPQPCGRGCADKPEEYRSFSRKDNFSQHLKHCHQVLTWDPAYTHWRSQDNPPPSKSRCGFCRIVFLNWEDRKRHIAEEFTNGRKIGDWEGSGLGFMEEEEMGGNLSNGFESQCLPDNDNATGTARQ